MTDEVWDDEFDWHGCSAVLFDPEKLGGRGTVGGVRMLADWVMDNDDDGMTAEEICERYELDLEPVREIIAYATRTQLKQSAFGFLSTTICRGRFRRSLTGHSVAIAGTLGWAQLSNCDLLKAAETAGFHVMLTGDQRMVYQQNIAKRRIALVVVTRVDRRGLQENIGAIISALARAVPAGYELVELPSRRRRSRR